MGCNSSQPQQKHTEQAPIINQSIVIGSSMRGPLALSIQPSKITQIKTTASFPKYCNAILASAKEGYITGGIEQLQQFVEGERIFKPSNVRKLFQGTVLKTFLKVKLLDLRTNKPQAITKMPDMINDRYAHSAVLFKDKLYVIGGREYGEDETGLLSACERFNFSQGIWQPIPPLQKPRSSCMAVVFKDLIYVFGGYTGKNKRSRTIQTYRQKSEGWQSLNVKLPMGIEGAALIPYQKNSFYIFGGKSNLGNTNQVYYFNIQTLTVVSKTKLTEPRSFHKFIRDQGRVILIGGGTELLQTYELGTDILSISKQPSYLEFCNNKQFSSLSQFQNSLRIQNDIEKIPKKNIQYSELIAFIIGHAKESFLKIVDFQKGTVDDLPQPMQYGYDQFKTILKVNIEYTFIMGGINSHYTKVSRKALSVHIPTQTIKQLPDMINSRYGFPAVVKGSYAYVFGGRRLGNDDVAIMSECERFSFETQKWQSLNNMKTKRHSSFAFNIGNYIAVVGGYKGNGVLGNDIEIFNDIEKGWVLLQQKFQLGAEGMSVVENRGEVYLFGGKTDEGEINRVFKIQTKNIKGEMSWQKGKITLNPMGILSAPGTNLKILVDDNNIAYIFGNKPKSIQVYDMNIHKVVKTLPNSVSQVVAKLQDLHDHFFKSYSICI